jgi:hypothetical protein
MACYNETKRGRRFSTMDDLSEGKRYGNKPLVGGSNPSATTRVFQVPQAFHTSLQNEGVLNSKSEILNEFEIQIRVSVSAPFIVKIWYYHRC